MVVNHWVLLGFVAMMCPACVKSQTANCIKDSCSGRDTGFYHDCNTCKGFVQCVHGNIYRTACQGDTFWDNTKKSCDYVSSTCKESPCKKFEVENGKYILKDNIRLATYTCNAGYTPRISGLQVECAKSDTQWKNLEPELCIKDTITPCGAPPVVDNGGYEIQNDPTTAKARCHDGFSPKTNTADISCVNGQWQYETDDICERGCVRWCVGQKDGWYASCISSKHFVICSNEITSEMSCSPGTEWFDSQKNCDVPHVTCNSLPELTNGRFNIESDTIAELQCNDGYTASVDDIECVNGEWLPDVYGKTENLCLKDLTCNYLPDVTNGKFNSESDTIAKLQCNDGYTASVDEIECVNGEWFPDVYKEIEEPCVKVLTCDSLPDVTNGKFNSESDTIAELQCNDGYTASDSVDRIECVNGKWFPDVYSETEELCVKDVTCNSLPDVTNGKFNTESDTIAKLKCNDGYTASLDEIECVNGEWLPDVYSETENLCVKDLICDSLPDVTNGKFNSESYTIAKLQCNDGYTASVEEIECVDGEWLPDVSSETEELCVKDMTCNSLPYMTNGRFNIESDTIAELQCNDGYTASVDETECVNGEWFPDVYSETEKLCVKDVTCNALPDVSNGKFNSESNTIVKLQCNDGYTAFVDEIECVNGEWFPDVYKETEEPCVKVLTCDSLPDVTNGKFNSESDTIAELQCNDGYTASESVDGIECVNGEWFPDIYSEIEELCVKDEQTCESTPEVQFGSFARSEDNPHIASLQCEDGHSPAQNDYTIECADGSWSQIPDNICIQEFNSTAKGKTFVVAFFEKFSRNDGGNVKLTIYMTSSQPANVNISSLMSLSIPTSYTLNGVLKIDIDPDVFLQRIKNYRTSKKSGQVLRIESDVDINVYSYNEQPVTATANIIHPVDSLGNEYMLVAGPENPSFAIIGLNNFTYINITYPDGRKSRTMVFENMVVYIGKPGLFKLTGTIVKSSLPIAVFSGNKCTNIPSHISACDTLIEQVPAIASLQYVYVLSFMYPRKSFRVEVVVPYDGTTIQIGTSGNATVYTVTKNKGESLIRDFDGSDTIYVTGSHPIMVVKYSFGNKYDNSSYGDPSMTITPGIGQFENEYFYTSIGDFEYEKVYIIVPKESRTGLRLNGQSIEVGKGNPEIDIKVPLYGFYTVVYVDVMKDMVQHLTHVDDIPIGVVQYGAASFVEYGFSLGYKMRGGVQ